MQRNPGADHFAPIWPQEFPPDPQSPLELVPPLHYTVGETEAQGGKWFLIDDNLTNPSLFAKFPTVFHNISELIENVSPQMLILSSWHTLACHLSSFVSPPPTLVHLRLLLPTSCLCSVLPTALHLLPAPPLPLAHTETPIKCMV